MCLLKPDGLILHNMRLFYQFLEVGHIVLGPVPHFLSHDIASVACKDSHLMSNSSG